MKHSIIIPTAGAAPFLSRTLESLVPALDEVSGVEVLVVENGPQLDKEDRVETFKRILTQRLREKVRYVYEPTWGLLAGRHKGVLSTEGDLVSFFDDDVVVDAAFSSAIYKAFADKSVELVGGPARPYFLGIPPSWLREIAEMDDDRGFMMTSFSLIDLRSDSVNDTNPNYIWGQNFHIRRHTLMELGGFHPDGVPEHLKRYRGDGETGLTMKFAAAGRRADYLAGVSVRHFIPVHRMTYEFLEQRSFSQGVSDTYSRIKARGSATDLIDPNFLPNNRDSILTFGHRITSAKKLSATAIRKRAHATGAAFLMDQYAQDSNLREWIHRPNYFDFSYPV